MPTNNRVSLNNKGAIFALRGEGYSLCKIRRELDIKRRAEKNIPSITVNFEHLGPLRPGLGALGPISGILRPRLVAPGLRLGILGQDRRLWDKDQGLRGQKLGL